MIIKEKQNTYNMQNAYNIDQFSITTQNATTGRGF
jgi:hypothetical protein